MLASGVPKFIAMGKTYTWFGTTSIRDYDPDYMPLGATKLQFKLDEGCAYRESRTGTIRGKGMSFHLNRHVEYDLIGSFNLVTGLVCLCLQARFFPGSGPQNIRRYVGFFDTEANTISGDYAHGSFKLIRKQR